MGQLFQPTNITPNLLGEIGQGVADVTQPLTLSWQVNGNVPMTGYKLTLFRTDTVSATISVTLPEPFYGRDAQGNVVMFTHTLSVLDMQNEWENGRTCAYSIQLYWGSGTEAESVTTLSKCVFLARSQPTLTMTVANPYTKRDLTASAAYSQAQGDGIMWVRWRLSDYTSGQSVLVDDTDRIYGTSILDYSYDGLSSGHYYTLNCTVQTENGVVVSSGDVGFYAEYSASDNFFPVSVSPTCGAMAVKWTPFVDLPLSSASSGTYSTVDSRILIESGAKMIWTRQDGNRMNLPPPWTFIWRGRALGDAVLFSITLFGGATLQGEYDATKREFSLNYYLTLDMSNSFNIGWVPGVNTNTEFCVAVTPSQFMLYDGTIKEIVDMKDVSYSWRKFLGLTMFGYQRNTFVKILDGTITEDDLINVYSAPFSRLPETVTFDPGTRFLLQQWDTFGSQYNAGNNAGGTVLTGYWLYRKEQGNQSLIPVVSGSKEVISILDYGVRNNAGPFQYYLFTENSSGEEEFSVFNTITDPVEYCDWSWVLLSCTKNDAGEYLVQKAYIFQNNITSGAMSNNNKPNVLDNFTRYPLIQISRNNYKSGVLQSLIGTVGGCQAEYEDSVDLRDEIMSLSTSTNYFFLKDRKGDLIMVRPSGEITMETGDNTINQEQRMSFPWVEIGNADRASVYQIV